MTRLANMVGSSLARPVRREAHLPDYRARRPDPGDAERGSISVFAVVVTLALIVVLGLVVDGGAKVHALQAAQATAREAARAGGQAVHAGVAVAGDGAVVDPAPARSAATAYLAAAGLPGTVTIEGGTRLRVEVTATYEPIFLGIVGIGTQSVHAQAGARLVRVIGGTEQ